MNTNFTKVGEFHRVFQHPLRNEPDMRIFNDNKLMNLRIKLIEEELNELKEAIKNKNMVEVGDALSDILYVVYGAGHVFGINLDETFELVHKSNMTKACDNEEQAIETVKDYMSMDETKRIYKNVSYKKSDDGNYYIIYDVDTGKILKNKYYTPVNLQYLSK